MNGLDKTHLLLHISDVTMALAVLAGVQLEERRATAQTTAVHKTVDQNPLVDTLGSMCADTPTLEIGKTDRCFRVCVS